MSANAQPHFPFLGDQTQENDDDTRLDDGSYAELIAPAVLSLELDLRDPDVIAALAALPEGRARTEYAIDALRIGVLALKNASSRIDSDKVRNEGERLLAQLQSALDAHAKQSKERTDETLQAYFDPKSGRLSERVERLVSDDGELARLLEKQLHGEASPLARLLEASFGRESPLMRQLDPQQSSGLLARVQKLVDDQLCSQREQIVREFSLDHEDSALRRLVNELTGKHGDLSKDLQEKIDDVVKEFSLDHEDSALSRLVQNVDRAQRTISSEFSLDNKESGLSRVKEELMTVLSAHVETNSKFQEEVKVTLAKLVQRKESAASSPEHGNIFEVAVCRFLQNEAQQRGDLFAETGNTTGQIRNCKVGDATVRLGPDSPAAGAQIVFEVKDARSYSMQSIIDELDQAKKNRSADFGVFVWARSSAPEGSKPLARYGSDLVVLWDAEDPATDPYLIAAMEIARACVVEFHRGESTEEIDIQGIEKAINAIEKSAQGLEQIKKPADTIKNSSEKILDRVRIDQEALEKQVRVLREKLAALRTS